MGELMPEFSVIMTGMNKVVPEEESILRRLDELKSSLDNVISTFDMQDSYTATFKKSLIQLQAELNREAMDMKQLKDALEQIISYYADTEEKLCNKDDTNKKSETDKNVLVEEIRDLLRNLLGLSPDCCVFGGDPVNLCTGNFIYHKEDMKVAGKFPLCFERYYNGMDTNKTVFSSGWRHNYQIQLSEMGDLLILQMGDGREERYKLNKNGTYNSIFGSYQSIKKVSDGYQYYDRKNRLYQFDLEGKLITIKDHNKNETIFTYKDGYLMKVSNSVGNSLEYEYNEKHQLIEVTDQSGRCIKLLYVAKMLTKVIGLNETETTYTYNNKGLIKSIINSNGITIVENEYDDKKRVIKQIYPDKGVMTYEYQEDKGHVILTQQNGEKIIYMHDEKYRHEARI